MKWLVCFVDIFAPEYAVATEVVPKELKTTVTLTTAVAKRGATLGACHVLTARDSLNEYLEKKDLKKLILSFISFSHGCFFIFL